ncbi:MAG: hypothetical protein K2R98_08490 [Gemmataceae bacterium]|nr:hypothetical protein [Gemmataceae bacterium]
MPAADGESAEVDPFEGVEQEEQAVEESQELDAPPVRLGLQREETFLSERASRPAYLSYSPRKSPAAAALRFGIWGAIISAPAAILSSQFFPVFANMLERALADPFSPARLSLIPIHLFAFSTVGFLLGCVVGYLHASK